jgi:hypothetical protein
MALIVCLARFASFGWTANGASRPARPPATLYAAYLQQEVDLPIFDFTSMITMVNGAFSQSSPGPSSRADVADLDESHEVPCCNVIAKNRSI